MHVNSQTNERKLRDFLCKKKEGYKSQSFQLQSVKPSLTIALQYLNQCYNMDFFVALFQIKTIVKSVWVNYLRAFCRILHQHSFIWVTGVPRSTSLQAEYCFIYFLWSGFTYASLFCIRCAHYNIMQPLLFYYSHLQHLVCVDMFCESQVQCSMDGVPTKSCLI